ncbi:unnamed protein product [Citrullus colocynthis]|uniref:Secreted protein n=1 Tax=Citrullus colocynthis TaxID=252529 RepID=A0ABP0YLB0_9ROSI
MALSSLFCPLLYSCTCGDLRASVEIEYENHPIIHSIRHPYPELGLSSSSRRLPQSTLSPSTTADNCTALLSEDSRRRPAQTVPAICSVDFLFAPPQTQSNDGPDSRRPEP